MSSVGAGRPARVPATLRESLRRALSLAAVVLGLLVVGALVSVVQVVRAQQEVTDLYYRATTEAQGGYVALLDAEAAVRRYAMTGDATDLDPFTRLAADAQSDAGTAALEDELAGQGEIAAGRERAVDAARRWFGDFAVPTVQAVRTGGPAAVTDAEVAAGSALFADTRTAAEAYIDQIHDDRAAALDRLRRWTGLLVGATAALVLGALAVGWALWVVLGRSITRPLAALAADAREVISGDLGHPVRAAGPGEIAALADDVETMRRVLVRQVHEAAQASVELTEAHRRLTEQAEELQRSNRDLEQFAYVASHDLQEPLRKVASFTQLLQKRYGGQLDDRADQYIEFAVDGAKRMQRLIQDLLGFSRVGRVTGEAVDVDLADALAEALDNLDQAVAEAGATVTHEALPVVRGERALVVQLLQNLVGNAVKFRDPGRPPAVRLTARPAGDRWEIACRDNGIGIDAQYADRVFVIFQRLHPKDSYEGTGIGLSLCKKIVEHHGGHIWVEPVVDGSGADIRFTLPAVPQDAPERDGASGESIADDVAAELAVTAADLRSADARATARPDVPDVRDPHHRHDPHDPAEPRATAPGR